MSAKRYLDQVLSFCSERCIKILIGNKVDLARCPLMGATEVAEHTWKQHRCKRRLIID